MQVISGIVILAEHESGFITELTGEVAPSFDANNFARWLETKIQEFNVKAELEIDYLFGAGALKTYYDQLPLEYQQPKAVPVRSLEPKYINHSTLIN